ncbi:MAG: hypothetical protein ACYC7E_15045 [Armatimonadota bacterium]
MRTDPIVDEVQRVRQAYAKRFEFDIQAIAADLRQHERQHVGRLVSYPAKPAGKRKTA